MFILQVFYPLSVVIVAVGMICYVMDFMLVMVHFNVTIMTQSMYIMTDKHAKSGRRLRTADCRPAVKCSLRVKRSLGAKFRIRTAN